MYGSFNFPHLPHQAFPAGVRLGPLTVIPGGANVHFVRSTGAGDYDPPELAGRMFATVNAALAQCRSGRGDTVLVLPGHTESISAADSWSSLVAGTQIVGLGSGQARPTFTWTAAAATVLLDVANVSIMNCRLFLAGAHAAGSALTVAAPITVSAAGCQIVGNDIWAGFDADQIVTIGITTTAAANDFKFVGNRARGEAAAVGTTFLRLVGGTDAEIAHNDIVYGTSAAAVGPIQSLTTAPTGSYIHHNYVSNSAAASTAAITPMAGHTGTLAFNVLEVAGTGLAHIVTGSSLSRFENYGKNTGADETGALLGTASA